MKPLEPYIMKKVVVLRESDTAFVAAKAMKARRIGCVIVMGGAGDVKGVVTDRDLVESVLASEMGPNTRLRDLMSRPIRSVSEDEGVEAALEVMKKYGIRRVPVTKKMGQHLKCVGMVSLDDLIAAKAVSLQDLSQIVKNQIVSRQSYWKIEAPNGAHFITEVAKSFYQERAEVENFVYFMFESIFRRLHYSSAIQFMLQLPTEVQEQLIHLEPGPDVSITGQYMVKKTAELLKMPAAGAVKSLQKAWSVFTQFSDQSEIENVIVQLPDDIQLLLNDSASPLRFIHADTEQLLKGRV